MYLNIGDRAPDFNVKNYNGKTIKLNDFKNNQLIIWFFPKASTPG